MNTNPAKNPYLVLALAVALGASVAVACGEDDPEKKEAVCDDGLDDDGDGDADCKDADCASAAACQTGDEICDNGEDDDGDELTDCSDPNCELFPACKIGGEDCSSTKRCGDDLVCVENVCEAAGMLDPHGEPAVGAVLIYNQVHEDLISFASRHQSYEVQIFHPGKPDGGTLGCDELVEIGLAEPAIEGLNVLRRRVGSIASEGGVTSALLDRSPVPVPGQGYVVLSRLYTTLTLEGEPAGDLVAIGCAQGVEYPPGEYVEDEDHTATVVVGPICTPNQECPNGKTCNRTFLCRDNRCEDCNFAEGNVCREVDGEPRCLPDCDPQHLDQNGCVAGERCDTTPGEQPACIPVE